MEATRLNSASANKEKDLKPLFGYVPFIILNGFLAALVLTSIAVAIVLIIELDAYNYLIYDVSPPWLNFLLLGIFYLIAIIVDLVSVVIGFNAVVDGNEASIDLFLHVSAWELVSRVPIVLISDIVWIWWVYSLDSDFVDMEKKIEILSWCLILLSLVRFTILVVIFSLFYKEVKKFDSTIQDRIVGPARFMINLLHEIYLYGQDCDNFHGKPSLNGPQNQQASA